MTKDVTTGLLNKTTPTVIPVTIAARKAIKNITHMIFFLRLFLAGIIGCSSLVYSLLRVICKTDGCSLIYIFLGIEVGLSWKSDFSDLTVELISIYSLYYFAACIGSLVVYILI